MGDVVEEGYVPKQRVSKETWQAGILKYLQARPDMRAGLRDLNRRFKKWAGRPRPQLDDLVEKGLVRLDSLRADEDARQKYYALTPEGVAAAKAKPPVSGLCRACVLSGGWNKGGHKARPHRANPDSPFCRAHLHWMADVGVPVGFDACVQCVSEFAPEVRLVGQGELCWLHHRGATEVVLRERAEEISRMMADVRAWSAENASQRDRLIDYLLEVEGRVEVKSASAETGIHAQAVWAILDSMARAREVRLFRVSSNRTGRFFRRYELTDKGRQAFSAGGSRSPRREVFVTFLSHIASGVGAQDAGLLAGMSYSAIYVWKRNDSRLESAFQLARRISREDRGLGIGAEEYRRRFDQIADGAVDL